MPESVAEKPYWSSEYPAMQQGIPLWGAEGNSINKEEAQKNRCLHCCAWCYSSPECGPILVGMDDSLGPWERGGSWSVEGPILGFKEFKELRYVPTNLYGVTLHTDLGIEIFVDETRFAEEQENDYAKFTVTYVEPSKKGKAPGLCTYSFWVYCETVVCPPEVSISWDDVNSAETIARSSTVNIYVQDGVGPYDWVVAGTGFTLGGAQTSGVSNTLIADGSACGPAVITITDVCGETTTGHVRCDTGKWNTCCSFCFVDCTGYTSYVNVFTTPVCKIIDVCHPTNQCAGQYDGQTCSNCGGALCPPIVWHGPYCPVYTCSSNAQYWSC